VKCNHVNAVEVSFALRKDEVTRIEPITDTTNCIFCSCSNVVKFGIRHNNRGDIPKFRCNDCKHYFTINLGFEKMHATPQMITSAMQLYFTGESLRNVERFLKLQGVVECVRTIRNPRTRHIKHIRLQGDHNNNKMERLNGEVRDREKVMRGLKKVDTPILKGYQIYHNYLRPHEGLNLKTPAEVCG